MSKPVTINKKLPIRSLSASLKPDRRNSSTFFYQIMPPTEKPALQTLQEKVSEAGISVLGLTIDSFWLLFKGDRILTRVRGSILPSIAAPVVLFAVYSSFFAAIRSTGKCI
jgi:hypothetical protein